MRYDITHGYKYLVQTSVKEYENATYTKTMNGKTI